MSETSQVESDYVLKNDDETVDILEAGYITPANVNSMKFSFDTKTDITERLEKKSTATSRNVSVTTNGRIGYAPLTCTYPDGTKSSKVVLTDVVVQYRDIVELEKNNYGKTYISVGVPSIYLEKMKKDARLNSAMNLTTKDKNQQLEGCYWMDFNLERLTQSDTMMIYKDKNNETQAISISFEKALTATKKSLTCNMMVTVSGSMTTPTVDEPLDLVNGQFYFALKPTEAFIMEESNKVGPVLTDAGRRKNERIERTESLMASTKLAEMVLSRLKIN